MQRPIKKPLGTPVAELDTPALIVDLDAFERNLESQHSLFRGASARLRPDAHCHKTPEIAGCQLAIDGSANGVAVASITEAEIFASAGISDILITTQLVVRAKIGRAAALAKSVVLTVVADDIDVVKGLGACASQSNVELNVLVDIQTDPFRGGIESGEPALALAQAVYAEPHLKLAGIYTAGATATDEGVNECDLTRFFETARHMEEAGLKVDTVSYRAGYHEDAMPKPLEGVTEVLAGAYALPDANRDHYVERCVFVLATVTCRPEPVRAVIDCGQKAAGRDFGHPVIHAPSGLTVARGSAEHGVIDHAQGEALDLVIGDQIWLVPSDVSTVFALHDVAYGVRDGRVEAVLDISARGAFE